MEEEEKLTMEVAGLDSQDGVRNDLLVNRFPIGTPFVIGRTQTIRNLNNCPSSVSRLLCLIDGGGDDDDGCVAEPTIGISLPSLSFRWGTYSICLGVFPVASGLYEASVEFISVLECVVAGGNEVQSENGIVSE